MRDFVRTTPLTRLTPLTPLTRESAAAREPRSIERRTSLVRAAAAMTAAATITTSARNAMAQNPDRRQTPAPAAAGEQSPGRDPAKAAAEAATTGRTASGAVRAMATRPIPSSGERIPVVGCGTWRGFDVAGDSAEGRELAGVLEALFAAGGSVIDSSPMYGRSEAVVGDLLAASGQRQRAFLATKVWTRSQSAGIGQMEESMRRLQTRPIDLMQVHNLVDWQTHLATLADWRREKRVRYVGVTHYHAGAFADLEQVMRSRPAPGRLDTVQFNYSVEAREAEARLLPLAADLGIAVIVNMPFGGGGLLRQLRDRPLPGWAAEIGCTTWAQALLKFVLGHPAVTCVIPGTGKAAHMRENAAAGSGPLPDDTLRRRIAADAA